MLSVAAAAADGAGRIELRRPGRGGPGRGRARPREALARTPAAAAGAGPGRRGRRRRAGPVRAARRAGRGASPAAPAPTRRAGRRAGRPRASALGAPAETGSAEFGYEVQYLLDAATDGGRRRCAARSAGLGDSLVVVGTGDGEPPTWNVHVHVNDVGAAIEAGVEAGRPHRITVTRVRRPAGTGRAGAGSATRAAGRRCRAIRRTAARRARPSSSPPATGSPSCSPPRARRRRRNPSTAEMLAAIAATGAGRVVLLPNDANTHAVASAAAARGGAADGIRVSVVPTRSPVQALAALAVRDPARRFDDDVIAMAEAAGACRYGEVCTAPAGRRSPWPAGAGPATCSALVEGEVHVIGTDLAEVCRGLLDRMLGGGGELVTLVARRGRPGRAGGDAARPPRAARGRSSRCSATPAASRTTPCWWESSDETETATTTDTPLRQGARATRRPRRSPPTSTCTPPATCSTTSRAATTSAASTPTSAALEVGEQVTVLAQVQVARRCGRCGPAAATCSRSSSATAPAATLTCTFFNQAWRRAGPADRAAGGCSPARSPTSAASGSSTARRTCCSGRTPTQDEAAEEIEEFAGALIPVYPAAQAVPTWVIAQCVRMVLDTLPAAGRPAAGTVRAEPQPDRPRPRRCARSTGRAAKEDAAPRPGTG